MREKEAEDFSHAFSHLIQVISLSYYYSPEVRAYLADHRGQGSNKTGKNW